MVFSSMVFLWVFLPIVIIVNYLLNLIKDYNSRIHAKNIFLLLASLVFYAWGGVYFLSIMLSVIIIDFFGAHYISVLPLEWKIRRNLLLALIIILNLAILIYFKYFNFIIVIIEQCLANSNNPRLALENIILMKGTGALNFKEVILPIGISFFTFQAMSYVIDVKTGKATEQKNILDFGLYVALFPQLIAGPIVKYSDVARQINEREETSELFVRGIKRFIYGLAKKVLLANTFASVVDSIFALNISKLGFAISLLAMFSYTFQIYYDFSGYSDMAIGLGYMFGFEFKENFNYPYTSLSITEFWRRWHISLSTWFKEYVYIPLGGNRCGKFRTCINLFIVFMLTGIWHGANMTFIAWGLSYAIILILEKIFLLGILAKNKFKILNFLYTFLIVSSLFVVFRCNTIYDAIEFFKQFAKFESAYSIFTFLSFKFIIVFVIGFLCMGVLQKLFLKPYNKIRKMTVISVIDFMIQIVLLILSILHIASGTYNPFIYFQF